MTDLVLTGGRIITGDAPPGPGWLRVSGGMIAGTGSGAAPEAPGAQRVELGGSLIVPGMIDMHCHGGGGFDFGDRDQDGMATAALTHWRTGTTTVVASVVSGPVAGMVDQVAALADLADDGIIAGVHLEGPFLSRARCGAHDPAVLRPPTPAAISKLLAAGRGAVRMVTLAPELDGSLRAIRQLTDAGVIAALGHTDATEQQIRPAIDAGATVATHLYNGMRPLHHREPGCVGTLLDDDRVAVELICDLVHVMPTAVRLAARHAGPRRTVLVTDAMAATGMSDGVYRIGNVRATVVNGAPRLPDGTIAASTLTMGLAFRNFVRTVGMTESDAVAATATRPATLLGLAGRVGVLAPGHTADLVVLDGDLAVARVMRHGRWVR